MRGKPLPVSKPMTEQETREWNEQCARTQKEIDAITEDCKVLFRRRFRITPGKPLTEAQTNRAREWIKKLPTTKSGRKLIAEYARYKFDRRKWEAT